MDDEPSTATTALECGQPFRAQTGAGLTLTGRFPAVVAAGQLVSGSVRVANETASGIRGVVALQADAFLVRDGRVATLPLAQDSVGARLELSPGEILEMPAQLSLWRCDQEDATSERSLAAGTYELYARVTLNRDDGSFLESVGGPWPLQVE